MRLRKLQAKLFNFLLISLAILFNKGPQCFYLDHQISYLYILYRVLHVNQFDLLQCDKISQFNYFFSKFENQVHIRCLAI